MQISDLVTGVREKLRNRKDVELRMPIWIQETILDLTMSYPFEELGVKGNLVNFISGQSEYPINYFLTGVDKPWTRILSWFIYFNQSGVITSADTGFNIKGRALQVVEPMSNIDGIPTFYCQQGSLVIVGFRPNAPFATYMRVQRKHPFLPAPNLANSPIYMPDDWKDIIEYGAAIKGCDAVGMTEVGNGYLVKLHGDPKEPGNLGLIQARQSQQRRNLTNNERQLQPVVRRYT